MNDTVEMRAEVGLLTRNIVVRGDDLSPEQEYGGHIILWREGCIGRISDAEFYNMGQLGQMGRYTIHFHQVGDASESYTKRSSMHHGFNRATTIHDTQYLTYTDNVC